MHEAVVDPACNPAANVSKKKSSAWDLSQINGLMSSVIRKASQTINTYLGSESQVTNSKSIWQENETLFCKNNVCVHTLQCNGFSESISVDEEQHHPGYLTVNCKRPLRHGSRHTANGTLILTWIPNDTLEEQHNTAEFSAHTSVTLSSTEATSCEENCENLAVYLNSPAHTPSSSENLPGAAYLDDNCSESSSHTSGPDSDVDVTSNLESPLSSASCGSSVQSFAELDICGSAESNTLSFLNSSRTTSEHFVGVFTADLSLLRRIRLFYSNPQNGEGQAVLASRENQYKVFHFHNGGLHRFETLLRQWRRLFKPHRARAARVAVTFDVIQSSLPAEHRQASRTARVLGSGKSLFAVTLGRTFNENDDSYLNETVAEADSLGGGDDDVLLAAASVAGFSLQPSSYLNKHHAPLNLAMWRAHLGPEGRLREPLLLRRAVFFGGIQPSLRKEVWPFLLSVYPFRSTEAEREVTRHRCILEYAELRRRRDKLEGEELVHFQRHVSDIVYKDVMRTDRQHPFFSGHDNVNVQALAEILLTYGFAHAQRGYSQGMSDLLAPILLILEGDQAFAYACFEGLLERKIFVSKPSDNDMDQQLELLRQLLKLLLPSFYQHLERCGTDALEMLFAHRWILLCFKREFTDSLGEDVLRVWEACWAHYVSDYFHLFICVALVQRYGAICVEKLYSTNEMLAHFSALANSSSTELKAEVLLHDARDLLYKFRVLPTIPCVLAALCSLCGQGMWDSVHVPAVECPTDPDHRCTYLVNSPRNDS